MVFFMLSGHNNNLDGGTKTLVLIKLIFMYLYMWPDNHKHRNFSLFKEKSGFFEDFSEIADSVDSRYLI